MRLTISYKVFALALIAAMAVGCEAAFDLSVDDGQSPSPDKPNKIVIPINRRPKTPGRVILEPRFRFDGENYIIPIRWPHTASEPYGVTVRSVATGEESRAELCSEDDCIIVPYGIADGEYEVTIMSEDGEVVERVIFAIVDAQ